MMMPANFTAIAENELTYVNGGAIALGDILADKLEVSNWKKFNTNMVTLIGNAFVGGYIDNTLGVLFSGNYDPIHNSMIGGWAKEMGKKFVIDEVDPDASYPRAYNVLHSANALLNVGLNIAGNAAAIYNLATGTVKNDASEKAWTIAG